MNSLLLSLAIVVGAPAVKDPPKKDPPSLVGVWSIESGIKGGKPSNEPPGATMEFSAEGTMVLKERGKDITGTYKADPKKEPSHLDLNLAEKGQGISLTGIYKIEGDKLTICLAFQGERPTKLESPDGAMTVLLTLKRAKKE